MVNYLSLLGWSPGGDATIFGIEESVDRFELSAVAKNPAVFDQAKLDWMNGEYIRALPVEEFITRALPSVTAAIDRKLSESDSAQFAQIAPLVQERTKLLSEVGPQVRFLFTDDLEIDPDSWAKVMGPEAAAVLEAAGVRLTVTEPWDHDSIEATLRAVLEELGLNARKGLQPLRVAITGSSVSPPLFESVAVLGRERTLERLSAARSRL
jgi:glutamyl-tRNA synthetase